MPPSDIRTQGLTASSRLAASDEQVAGSRESISKAKELMERFLETIGRQESALARLNSALRSGESVAAQEKALRETTTYLFTFRMLGEQIEPLLPELERVVVQLVTDLQVDRRQHEQMQALAQSAEIVNSTLELSAVLEQVMDMLISLTGAERGYLMLVDERTGELEFSIARNLDHEALDSDEFQVSRTVVRQVASDGQPVLTTDAAADPRFKDEESVVGYNLRSILCVPLKVKNKVIGVIYADNRLRTGLFTEADRNLLATFANQAATAIDNARLFENVTAAKVLMQNVFESIASAVITVGEGDRVTLFNPAAERLFGLSADEVLDDYFGHVLNAIDSTLPVIVEDVKQSGRVIVGHELEPTVAGRGTLCLLTSLAPLTDPNGVPYGVAIVLDDLTERKRFERERSMVKRYLPAELVDQLSTLEELRLGGARAEVSIFFADIRGFTAFSETRDPIAVVEAINGFFGMATRAVSEHRGIVDKYMGDAVMAHYNSPLAPQEDHAWLAVRTAWATKRVLAEFKAANPEAAGLQVGIGVNTGDAVAGNVGASEHMAYTLIGDAVNLAKRLQENASGGQVLLGSRTYELVRDRVTVHELEPLRVKGRRAYEQVYELTGLVGEPSG